MLPPGRRVQFKLQGSTAAVFRITAVAGKLLAGSLEQGDDDLEVCLYTPEGSLAVGVDGFESGSETFTHVASRTGWYRLEIRPVAATRRNAFSVQTEIPAPPAPRDLMRVDAEAASTRAKLGPSDADAAYQMALDLWRKLGDGSAEARLQSEQCEGAYNRSDFAFARTCFENVAAVAAGARDNRTASEALNGVGVALMQTGDAIAAERAFTDSLQGYQRIRDDLGIASASVNLAQLHWRCADFDGAMTHYREGLRQLERLGDQHGAGLALTGLALAYRSTNEPAKALTYLERAVASLRQTSDRAAEANAWIVMGHVQFALGKSEAAAVSERRALDLLRDHHRQRAYADAELNLSRILEFREAPEARRLCEDAADLYRTMGDRRGLAGANHLMGRLLAREGRRPEAIQQLEESIRLRREAGLVDAEADALSDLAGIMESAGDLKSAAETLGRALDVMESVRARTSSPDTTITYFAGRQDSYERQIGLLMKLKLPEDAYLTSERARSRSLLDSIGAAKRNSGSLDALDEQRQAMLRQINFESSRTSARSTGVPHDKDLDALTTRYQEIERQKSLGNPRAAALARPQPMAAKQIAEMLDDDVAVLEFSVGTSGSYLFAVTRKGLQTFELPGREELEPLTRDVIRFAAQRVRSPETRAQAGGTATKLGRALFAEQGDFQRCRRWLIVPDGILFQLPFAALPSIERAGRQISLLPSASLLGAFAGQESRGEWGHVAIFADPVFALTDARIHNVPQPPERAKTAAPSSTPLGRLAFSTDEANSIGRYLSRTSGHLVLTGVAATKQRFLNTDWSKYDVIHISSHAEADAVRPDRSWIAFSQIDSGGTPVDGLVHMSDIYGMKLAGVKLVVLSGCSTGVGKSVRGEGVISFGRAFLSAGASHVVVSLWKVDDQATAELMRLFYDGILGKRRMRPAAALSAAQAALRLDRRWLDPFFWAGFTLVSGME